MTFSIADLVRRLAAAGASPEAIAIAVEAVEEAQAQIGAWRSADRERKARQRGKSRDGHGTVTGQSAEVTGLSSDIPAASPEERKVSPCTPSKETHPSYSDADASGAAAPPAYTDARHELWGEGKPILLELGVPERQCGQLIGRWLKTTGDDCAGVLDAIQRAREARPHDPIPWITRALPTKANHDRQSKRHQHELLTAFDKLENHARRMEDAHAASGWGRGS